MFTLTCRCNVGDEHYHFPGCEVLAYLRWATEKEQPVPANAAGDAPMEVEGTKCE